MIIFPMLNIIVTGLDNPITKLGNDSSEEIITFPYGGGYNTDLNLTLPEGAIINSAEMELQGVGIQGVSKPFDHTFSDTVNNNAWKGATTEHPPTSTPSTFATTAFTNTDYSNIKTSDNVRASYSSKFMDNYTYHLFRFKVTETGITNLNVYWEGYGILNGPSISPYKAYLYIWNSSSLSWELLGSNESNINPIDFVIQNNSFGNPNDYINSSNFTYIMAQGPKVPGGLSTSVIKTDFVKVVVTGLGISYPENPTFNIGDDDDVEWEFSGIFDQSDKIDENNNFKSELQSLIDSAEPGCQYVDIPLNFTSTTEGKIKIFNISISYEFSEINIPPYLIMDIPNGTFGFYEDTTGGDDLIDLNDYFWDDRDNGSLIFVLLKNNEEVHMELDIDGHHLDFYSAPDYFGTCEFHVRAIDKGLDGIIGTDENLYTDSNVFTVTVWPTNDAPVIDSIGNKILSDSTTDLRFSSSSGAREDEWFNKTIIAHDIDGDSLIFSCNITLVSPASIELIPDPISNNKTNLAIYATNDYVGILDMNIIVSDNNDSSSGQQENPSIGPLTDYMNLTIRVKNSNDPPKLTSMGEIIGYEDQWLNFSLNATDDDLIHGDRLKFSTNITTEMEGLIQGVNYEFNEESGEISILPDNDMVGRYWLEFDVSDFDDKSDSKTVNLVVNNVNDPPLPLISWPSHKQKYNTTTLINFDGTDSTDDDLIYGDILSYHWSSNISGVLSTEPKFSTNLTEVGWHKITLSVNDGSSEEAQEYIEIQIIPSKVPSDKKDKDGDDDDKPLDDLKNSNKTGDNEISASLIGSIIVIIVVILILISTFLLHRKKAKDKAEADIEEPNRTTIASVDPDLARPLVPVLPGTLQPMASPEQPMLPMPQQTQQQLFQQQQLQLQQLQLQEQQLHQLQLQQQQLQSPQQPLAQPLTLPPEAQPETEPLTPSPTQPPEQSPQNQQNP
jgi:hypothetical protein